MFAGVGVALSILEISDAGQAKALEHLTKLAEDRREDVKNLFKRLEDK